MVFIFWQGIISIHQKTFLEALSREPSVQKVILVVEKDITPYRKDMGWEVPTLENVAVVLAPSKDQIISIVRENTDAVHVMGGIRSGRVISEAFDACVKYHCRLGIMTEPFNDAGLKGWLRAVKYRAYKLFYFRHIQFVLAIGKQGMLQYENLGYDTRRLFPWGYFISLNTEPIENERSRDGAIRIIYAGRLEAAKGIYRFTQELVRTSHQNYLLDIYGEGIDEGKLRNLVAEAGVAERIGFFPFLPHEELLKRYKNYDWVVLPSAGKDGWGVIVSEGLLYGLRAICSSICGVSGVITNGVNGLVFHWAENGSCRNAIAAMLENKNFEDSETISRWARRTISGAAGAKYFIEIMNCVYNHNARPEAPWRRAVVNGS